MSASFFSSYIEPLTTWLNQHPHWAGIFTFLISFSESLAIVGTIVPGTVTMTAIGMLIGSGVIPGLPIFIWAILGAIVGDSASYFLGYYYHHKITSIWPFTKHPKMLESGNAFFKQHGGKSVFIGRFLGPLRSIIPVIAGMMQMPNGKFLVANITSAILWSGLYIAPGVVIGNAATELSPQLATTFLIYILIGLSIIWISAWIIKFLVCFFSNLINKNIQFFWKWLRKHPKLQVVGHFISDPNHPHDHFQVGLVILAVICFILLTLIAINAYTHGFVTTWDVPLFTFLQSIRTLFFDKIFMAFSFIGDKKTLLPLLFLLLVFFIVRSKKSEAVHWLSNGIIAAISVYVLKPFVNSPRPDGLVQIRHGYSFPSGHTTLSLAILGFLIFLIAKNLSKPMRRFILIPGIFVIGCIAVSRVYLGMHWFSDIIGSVFLSSGILCIHIFSYQRGTFNKLCPKQLILVSSLVIGLFTSYFMYYDFDKALKGSQLKSRHQYLNIQKWWDGEEQLPSFRRDRFGKQSTVLNIQWNMPLLKISKRFKQNGWQKINHKHISNRVKVLLSKEKKSISLFQQLYNNRAPVLLMIKDNLIFRLWRSNYHFYETKTPLWIGAITKLSNEPHTFSHFNQNKNTALKLPLKTLLSNETKQLDVKIRKIIDNDEVILIKQS